jgi:hypothetical protein
MDEDQTRKALDRLADMYLTAEQSPPKTTESAPPPDEREAASCEDRDQQELPLPPDTLPQPNQSDERSADVSPLPFNDAVPEQRRPKAASQATPRRAQWSPDLADQLDGPAPIRLTHASGGRKAVWQDRDEPDVLEAAAPSAARVEAVFLGNLPGFAGPWLTQYAQFIADQHGPVVVLNVDREQVDLELVGAASDRGAIAALAQADNMLALEGLMAALTALTQPGLPRIGAWLVNLPMPLDETSRHIAPDLDCWTLVCGSDQAALVGAYQWIKQLVGDEEPLQTRRVGLMVMGSDPETAETMAGNLAQTAGSFLKTPVELIGSRKKIDPVQLSTLGSFEADERLWPQVVAFLADQAELSEDASTPAEAVVADAPRTAATEDHTHAPSEDPGTLNLSQFLAQSTALEARCPYQRQMQIAVDPHGRLHLLLAHQGTAGDLGAAIMDLAQARTWVRQHAALLQLTWPTGRIDAGTEAQVHLFTAHTKAAVAMVGHVGPETRLHLLQQVDVGSAQTWFCTELN